jgi:glucan 1,3-beta-glucosidase
MQKAMPLFILTADEVGLVRKLVRAMLSRKQSPNGIKRISQELHKKLVGSEACTGSAADHMIEVVRLVSLTAACTALADHRLNLRKHLPPGLNCLSQVSTLRANLTKQMQKWRAAHSGAQHDHCFARCFRKLCWNESLKVIYAQLQKTKPMKDPEDKQKHALKARLADVRAEIMGDMCSMPHMREEGHTKYNDNCQRATSWRGVNLGGWLLWEPGPANRSPLVASLGTDQVPECEWTLMEKLVATHGRAEAESMVHKHRSTHVTRDDFVQMKMTGLNSVRVPFGYWAVVGPRDGEPFMGPCTEFLDAVLEWGAELELSIVLCFHSAVGFQSYDPPCGRFNEKWKPSSFDVAASVDVLRQVAQRYGHHPALGAICALNEPHGDLPARTLNEFFKGAYQAMRVEQKLPESVQIMLPVFHHEFKDLAGIYTPSKGFVNVVFDVHCYQVFGDPYAGWCRMSLADHLRYATGKTSSHPVRDIVKRGERVVVTEFSLALPMWNKRLINMELKALSSAEQKLLHRSFAQRQLRTFADYTEGWFFWCWKDDSGPDWALTGSIDRGWMPAVFGGGRGRERKFSTGSELELVSSCSDSSLDLTPQGSLDSTAESKDALPAKRPRLDSDELIDSIIRLTE